MPIATRVKRYLQANGARFKVHRLASPVLSVCEAVSGRGIEPSAVAFARVYEHRNGKSLLVYPLTHKLSEDEIKALLGPKARCCELHKVETLFDDCAVNALPPIGAPYGLKVVIDPALLKHETVYFRAGCEQTLIATDLDEFRFLNPGALVARFSEPGCDDLECLSATGLEAAVCAKLKSLQRLPPMPANVVRILQLVNDPDSSARDLATLVETDPSLSLQVMRHARSALFGYRGKVETVQDAITRVLGFDLVSNIALGLAACQSFHMPSSGPLSLGRYWRHSLYSAELARRLAAKSNPSLKLVPAKAYLCGMLHQFGLVLLAHLFPPEFNLFCRLVEREPEEPLFELEKRVMGFGQARDILSLGYGRIGGWLLEEWQMPAELVSAAIHHTQPGVNYEQQPYVALMQLVNYLLTRNQIEYTTLSQLDSQVCALLGISIEEAQAEFEALLESSDSIEQISSSMAAA
ncbi:HDOD domain-containing protein [Aestuariirhabdus litorea]|uniref:HDOD domain-containing protein n=1 Tax=Aestuariirhabdus litorea TaxID=2528527 RepID=A0A3P3VWQ1_9GAMM|nr:HDOD domain-containing protein [Aestuariirhabdus litorea]RRJ85143.1 HDOD domain-containing protein [Aestuariirhabdus litorea]RWW98366.1 HDOD domain-containing protein [Endozoicomonadaceae bacterium GTF-13]